MKQFGVRAEWKNNEIRVGEQSYQAREFTVEADWTGASYWYQLAALSDKAEIKLKNLSLMSLQGDCEIASWFKDFGVESKVTADGVIIKKIADLKPKYLQLNFIENPDVAQTMAVLCVLKKVAFHFTGLETLKIKETDRIAALQNELAKFGAEITEPQHGELKWDGSFALTKEDVPLIATYHDHRMALAFAPAALFQTISIDEPMVISKSYPQYYEHLKQVGFSIEKE